MSNDEEPDGTRDGTADSSPTDPAPRRLLPAPRRLLPDSAYQRAPRGARGNRDRTVESAGPVGGNSRRLREEIGGKKIRHRGLQVQAEDGRRGTLPVSMEEESPITVPTSGCTTGEIVPIRNPPRITPEEAPEFAAPRPPPGYRYDMVGRLVPVVQARVSLADPRGQEIFLEILQVTGSVRAAMDAVGIASADTVGKALDTDPQFLAAYEAAIERHRDGIYAAALQRAVHGWEVPILGGQFKDEIVAYERKYSDSILALMLKRHYKEFREAAQTGKVEVTNNTMNVQPTIDVSKLDKTQRAALKVFLKSLPAPEGDKIIDVED